MLVTNGKKIVSFPKNDEELESTSKLLKKRAKDVLGISAKFEIKTDEHYSYISNDKELSFQDLKQLCIPDIDIQFRAIGNESVQLPETKMKDIKHTFSQEEKMQIADEFCNAQYDKEIEEAEAKAVAKQFKSKIDALETKISELSTKHRQGYEMRNVETLLHLDFESNTRVYTDKETGDVLFTENMQPQDKQMRISFNQTADETIEDDNGFFEEEEDEVINF